MLGSQEQDESNDLGCNWNSESQRLFSSPGINFNPQLYRQEEPEGTSPHPTPSPAPRNLITVHSQGFNSGPCASLLCCCSCLLGRTCTFESFLGIYQTIRDLNAGIITLNFAIAMTLCLTQNSNKKQLLTPTTWKMLKSIMLNDRRVYTVWFCFYETLEKTKSTVSGCLSWKEYREHSGVLEMVLYIRWSCLI